MIVNNAYLVTRWPSQPRVEGALLATEGKSVVDFGPVGKLVERLSRAGIWERGGIAVCHGPLSPEEESIFRGHEVWVAHGAQSDILSGVGALDLQRAASSGVRLALGTDGVGQSIADEFRVAAYRQRTRGRELTDAVRLAFRAAFAGNSDLATRTFGPELGRIKPGARADLVVLDYRPSAPIEEDEGGEQWFWGAIPGAGLGGHCQRQDSLSEWRVQRPRRRAHRSARERGGEKAPGAFVNKLVFPFVALLASGCGDSPSPTANSLVDSSALEERTPAGSAQSVVDDIPFRTILCFGDSITYGVTLQSLFLPPGTHGDLALVEGYVPKLRRRLEEKYGAGFELINAGIPGERAAEGVERLRQEVRIFDPDLVLLLQGVVDVNGPNARFPVVRESLAEMMRIVGREGRVSVIGTYLLLNPGGFRGNEPENVIRLNDVIRQEARAQGVVIADHERAAEDLSGQGPDGLHPNNNGYEAMADTWLAAIEALAESMGGT
ncbi:MAG: GDSL-type esterase/lipase family protein [Vicinamibacteria bacterium]